MPSDKIKKTRQKHNSKPKKQVNIRARLMRGIVFILFLTILIPVIAYNNLPDWTFYLTSATRLWLATDEIESSYATADFLETLHSVEKGYDSSIELFSKDGNFIYSSRDLVEYLPMSLSQANTVDAKYLNNYKILYGSVTSSDKGYLIKKYQDERIDADFLVCFDYLPGGERVEVCMQVSQVTSSAKIDFIFTFVFLMLLLVIDMLIISAYLKRFVRPVQSICDITDKMSKLDFSQKCPQTKITELTQLSESINDMSVSLDNALTDLKGKNQKLLEDIANERTIDNLRQTFISGISHEMKTPIAIIEGYAEGAKVFYAEGNTETASKYCDIIMDETQRMNNMIMRLLEITKYESGAYVPQTDIFNLGEIVDDWFDRNSAILAEKGIATENTIDKALLGKGDKIILESVVNNYLSNAVSHCEGDKTIKAFCEEVDGKYRVYIYNTGKHIADKDIDKIWTSFYRADKSLSRSQGRFGLGLAIVASIQRLHGNSYGVQNTDGGVVFWFDITKEANK